MTVLPTSRSDSEGASHAFDLLHPRLQRWVHEQGWTDLHDAQEQAISPILDGDRDVIISAATAAGKTEAAFLPICSAIAAGGRDIGTGGVEVLCVSPLKALINDQFDRLELLCERAGVAVHRWHGDVATSAKAKVLKAPSGVLLMTPESLEAAFGNRGTHIARLFASLRYVVVDELHSFLGEARGAQLQSLLNRVELAIRRRPPRIGLSATLGDMEAATAFLRPTAPERVLVISSTATGHGLRLQVRGYCDAPPADESETDDDTSRRAIAQHLYGTLRGRDNLVFANRRTDVELYADLLARTAEEAGVPNEFHPHHGSLAKDVREVVEAHLKDRTRPVTAVCTSTLEMGIDIGSVASVAQIGPPPSVTALRQRLGRSGRRDAPAELRIYVSEAGLDVRSGPVDQLRPDVVQTIAMVRLLLDRWLEPPGQQGLQLSTLVQQTLSLIAQHGGVTAQEAYRTLCGPGPFAGVDAARFTALLRAMHAAELVVQAGDGTLLHGPVGERAVNHYSFYAAFQTAEEWRLVAEGRTLGSLPVTMPLFVGGLLIFAGRRWRITDVLPSSNVVELEPAKGGNPPTFGGGGALVSDRVRAEMASVYQDDDVPAWLDPGARELLSEGRQAWRRMRLGDVPLVAWGTDAVLFPWVGDRALGTLVAALAGIGVTACVDGPALTLPKTTVDEAVAAFSCLAELPPPDPVELARHAANRVAEKWDWVLDDDLSAAAYAARSLDVPTAWDVAARVARAPERDVVVLPRTPRRRRGYDFCIVDVETTGFSPRLGDRVVEIAAVRIRSDGEVVDEWTTLVDPARDIGPTHIHGITAADVVGAPRFAEVAGDLLALMDGAVLSGHNVRFDWTFLAAEFEQAGHPLPDLPKVCTLMLGQRLQPWLRSRKLAACCEALGIELVGAHAAVNDARAAARLLACYLATARTNGMTELDDLGCDPTTWPRALPPLQPCGRRHERGSRVHIDAQAAYLARLVRRLDDDDASADPDVAGYLDVLDRAVEDRRVTATEGKVLYETAAGYGLSSDAVAAAHRRYVEGLAHAALADGVVTDLEREDLSLVCRLLDVAESVLDDALVVGRAQQATSVAAAPDLAGLSVCFTGALGTTLGGLSMTRSTAEQLATGAGLRVVSNVSSGTDFLVVADPDTMSGKARRARELGVRIVAEQVFWAWLGVPVR